MESHSDLATIRQFLFKGFSDGELSDLCFDYFPIVKQNFTYGMTKKQKIRLLLEYCQKHDRWIVLLGALQRERPKAYDEWFPEAPQLDYPLGEEGVSVERNPRQIFICHASQDTEFAQRLAKHLLENGWPVWIAPNSIHPGEKWVDAINRGLEECGIFLLILTPYAVQSRWVKSETNSAIQLEHEGKMRFIPLKIESQEVLNAPVLWQSYQYVSFTQDYGTGFQMLINELRTQLTSEPLPLDSPASNKTLQMTLSSVKNTPMAVRIGSMGILFLIILWFVTSNQFFGLLEITPTSTSTHAPTFTKTSTPKPTSTNTPTATATLFPTPTNTPFPVGYENVRVKDNMSMVYIPAGTFNMGSTELDLNEFVKECKSVWSDTCTLDWFVDELPAHEVYLDSFWIDKTEVTNIQYQSCVNEGACKESKYSNYSIYNGDLFPVVGVSWQDAQDYCSWAGAHLPSEAQWEYAARGSTHRIYPWGNSFDPQNANSCDQSCDPSWEFWKIDEPINDTFSVSAPVGSFPSGNSWAGVQDMAGNAYEWVYDWYNERYDESNSINPTGPRNGTERVLRGGAYSVNRFFLRTTERTPAVPDSADQYIGFRCACTNYDQCGLNN